MINFLVGGLQVVREGVKLRVEGAAQLVGPCVPAPNPSLGMSGFVVCPSSLVSSSLCHSLASFFFPFPLLILSPLLFSLYVCTPTVEPSGPYLNWS